MKPGKIIFFVWIAVALPLACGLPAHAQRRMRQPRVQQVRQARARRPGAGLRQERRRIPRNWMERLQGMSPRQQERFLENNRRFRNLPPGQQARIRARLKQWNSLTPQQRQILIRRARIFESMSPRERREIRQVILPQWRSLPPERRRLLVGKLQQLQGLSDAKREKRLRDPQFVRGLSPKEKQLLKRLSELKVGLGRENP
ncbi:MAG TPA: DUF3106 domain-containing protein [Candidatus Dormibacteraeota bacterium]|nr:DUF3106 domain-containing protein [Candidatus Dormibacteraeota bacterium]